MKKRVFTLIAAALMSSSAMANGYWDYRQVCDYEQVQTQTPITNCSYAGYLTAWLGGSYTSKYFTDFTVLANHVNCPSTYFASHFYTEYNSSTQQWDSATFNGYLSLANQSQTYNTTTTTQVVEGSCRMERVWVELCSGCQIP